MNQDNRHDNADLFDDEPLPDDVLDHLDDPEIRARWPEALVSMLDVVAAAMRREIDEDKARHFATVAVRAIAKYHGGRMFYLPKGEALEQALRDKAMWDEYNHTRDDVIRFAARYRLTEQQVYKILRTQRAIHRKRIQPDLLD